MKSKKIRGIALKDSRGKTVLVEIYFLKIHPLYQKRYFSRRKILAETKKEIKAGQSVLIQGSRPISRRKTWKIVEESK